MLLTDVADGSEAHATADRLSDALGKPYELLGDAETLLREADAAMYRAKLAV